MVKLMQLWSALQQREKITIGSGTILVLLTALYLIVADIWAERSTLLQERTALLAEQMWMLEQSGLAEQLLNNCRDKQILELPETDLLELLASRNQLQLTVLQAGGTNFALQLGGADGNDILRFIHQSACQGFMLTSVQIEKGESGANYTGRVEFRHES